MYALFSVTLLAAPAQAQSSSSSSSSSRTVNPNDPRDIARRAPVMPVAQASEIALKRVRGTVLGAMIETNDGIRTWQIDIQANDGQRVRIWLNASTGVFLKMVDR
jgi:uncharacterized membrane protein YkoI